MPRLIDFKCPECGAVREGFKCDIQWCTSEQCDINDIQMQPTFSPKNNGQRWRFRDEE